MRFARRCFVPALLLISIFLPGFAVAEILPFELPQKNPLFTETLFRSADHPRSVFVVEAYFRRCVYCQENALFVNDLAELLSREPRAVVLDVGIDATEDDYLKWVTEHAVNHRVLQDEKMDFLRKVGLKGMPSAAVINCRGEVVYKTLGTWSLLTLQDIYFATLAAVQDCPP